MSPALITLTLIVFFVPAAASAQDASPSAAVGYGDLDLQSEKGIRTLDARLQRAIRTVCGDHRGMIDLSAAMAARRCAITKGRVVETLRDRALAARTGAIARVEP